MTLAAAKAGAVPPAAEAMFREGRRLMAEGNVAQACAQFAGSYALEPASGTLLNLALCHEKEGKIATAWAEFRAAATLAREQDRRDRSAAAEERIAVLEPKLAYVTVVAPPGIADLTVTDDESGSSALGLGTAVPVDAGIHHLHAIAPGYRAWMTKFEIADGEQRTVEIANLEPEQAPRPSLDLASPSGPSSVLVGSSSPAPSSFWRSADFYVATGGAVLLFSGTVLWGVAYSEFGSAKAACNQGTGCSDYDHRVSVIHTLQGFAIGAWAVGGAAVLASGLHYWFRKPPALQVALDPLNHELGIYGAF